jgi:alanine racemase
MAPEFSHPARLVLDGDALVSNWKALAKLSGKASTGAAVKANGYGLGAVDVASRLAKAGCRDFFVAHWAEAKALSPVVPPEQIAVLNGVNQHDIALAKALGARPVLNTPMQIALWKAASGGPCHIMLDSGINRLGLGYEQMDATLFDGLDIDIAMSHLASADQDVPQNAEQLSRFREMVKKVPARRLSMAGSAGIGLGTDYHFDLTRPGLSLYGGIARSELGTVIKPVVSIMARVLQIRTLSAGAAIGYNATYKCVEPTRVATISIGYADGYLRSFSNKGSARYHGQILPVVGRVSMDLVTLDVSETIDLAENDWVEVAYDLPAASSATGISQYELLTVLGSRFERVWS